MINFQVMSLQIYIVTSTSVSIYQISDRVSLIFFSGIKILTKFSAGNLTQLVFTGKPVLSENIRFLEKAFPIMIPEFDKRPLKVYKSK